MGDLENEIFRLFEQLEVDLKDEVVMDGNHVEYFEDAATDYVVDTKFQIAQLILSELPELIANKQDLNNLTPVAICSDINQLATFLSENKSKFPLTFEFIESRTYDDFTWQPLQDALRDYFDEDLIESIASEYEFNLACAAFLAILQISPNFYSYGEFDDFRFNVSGLLASSFAKPQDISSLEELLEILTPAESIHLTPTERVYEGSTGGIEPRFIEWLEKHHKSSSIFDEDDFDFDAPTQEDDNDWENLLGSWLETDGLAETTFENYLWIPIDVRAEIDYVHNELRIFFEIHQISRIIRDPNKSHLTDLPESMEQYKITMYRTGERHEYDSVMDRSLLALQVLLFHEHGEVPIENIEAEISWIRLQEKAYPLLSLSKVELEEVSRTYLDAQ